MQWEKMIAAAVEVAPLAFCPYSSFHVGAAIATKRGAIITGVNVENRSFGLTICAERSAFVRALSMGETDYEGIVIYTPDSLEPVSPCGACRQFMSEFVPPEFPILFSGHDWKRAVETTMGNLLPFDSLHNLKDELR